MLPAEPSAYQERLARFTRIWALVLVVVSLAVTGFYAVNPTFAPPDRWTVRIVGGVAAVVLGVILILLHRGQRTARQLAVMDAMIVVLVGIVTGVSAYYSEVTIKTAPLTAFIWQTCLVFNRTTIVPSQARRTALVSSASYLPHIVSAYLLDERPIPYYVVFIAFLSVVAVVLATAGSHVVYGLRRAVSEAKRLGQYTLDRKIGAGAMGEVWLAHHALLRRPTALKFLPMGKSNTGTVRRFEREVQQLARLTHPNTVAVYDYGHTVDGIFYYVMEYLDGMDLSRLVARYGPLPPARVVHIVAQVCGSLDEAHEIGLIHRDIKPANIILCKRGLEHDVAKVVDFGLVKQVDSDSASSMVIAGTPAFIAPEAVTDPDDAGPAADLYSIGATAYFLLTGERVFDAKTAVELYAMHATRDPVPPSARNGQAVPADLEALVMQCLSKDPAARPASAAALRLALLALPVAGEWDAERAAAWWSDKEASAEAEMHAAVSADTMTVDLATRTPPTQAARTVQDRK